MRKFREDHQFDRDVERVRRWLDGKTSVTGAQVWMECFKRPHREYDTEMAQRTTHIIVKKLGWMKTGRTIVGWKKRRQAEYIPKPPIVAIYEAVLG